jgi:cytochrome c-type biogenesis protein CcmE
MRHTTRSLIIGAVVIVAALGFVVYQGLASNLVYYITPSELLAQGPTAGQSFRVGGQVKPGSIHWNVKTASLRFIIRDPKTAIPVVTHGEPPQLFRAGAGVVVEGTFAHGLFSATTLMIHHDNRYVAPKPGSTPAPDTFEAKP